jgi:hypothetical protein
MPRSGLPGSERSHKTKDLAAGWDRDGVISASCKAAGLCNPLERRYIDLREAEEALWTELANAEKLRTAGKALAELGGPALDLAGHGEAEARAHELLQQVIAEQHRVMARLTGGGGGE